MVRLTFGGGILDCEVDRADKLLLAYRSDDGLRYLDFVAVTPPDQLAPFVATSADWQRDVPLALPCAPEQATHHVGNAQLQGFR